VLDVASRYSDSGSSNAEYDEEGIEAKLNYRTATGSQLSLVAARIDGSYPNQTQNTTPDTDYPPENTGTSGSASANIPICRYVISPAWWVGSVTTGS